MEPFSDQLIFSPNLPIRPIAFEIKVREWNHTVWFKLLTFNYTEWNIELVKCALLQNEVGKVDLACTNPSVLGTNQKQLVHTALKADIELFGVQILDIRSDETCNELHTVQSRVSVYSFLHASNAPDGPMASQSEP